jgi:hypothetical protein
MLIAAFGGNSQTAKKCASLQPSNTSLIEGQSYSITATVTDSSTNAVTTLGQNAFSVSIGSLPLSITSVQETGATTGIYTVNFKAPTSLVSAAALTVSANGVASSSAGNYSVVSVGTASSQSSWALNSATATTNNAVSTTLNFAGVSNAGTTLTSGTQYVLGTITVEDSSGNPVTGLASSAFTVTYGTSTTNLVSAMYTSSNTYTLVITAPTVASSSGQAFNVTVNGTSIPNPTTGDSFTINGAFPAVFNSSSTFPTGNSLNQLVAGQSYSINVNLMDQYGNPVAGLTAANFLVGETASAVSEQTVAVGTAASTVVSTALPVVSAATVTAGSTSGNYTVTFQPKTVSSGEYLALVVDPAGTVSLTGTTDETFIAGGATKVTVVPATVYQYSLTPVAGPITSGTGFTVGVTAQDKYGNTITSDNGTLTIGHTGFTNASSVAFSGAATSGTGNTTLTLTNGTASFTATVTDTTATDTGTITVTDGTNTGATGTQTL